MELTTRRDHVIERLSSDYASGAFEVEELERRLALAHAANSVAELDALVPAAPARALVPAKALRVVFGSIERVGPWDVPAQLTARVAFGNLALDLREARLAPGVTEIAVDITFGNVEVILPPGVEVEVDARAIFGSIQERTEPATGTAKLRIVGTIKLGSLELWTLHAGETRREARWRRRQERRYRRRIHRHALPWR